MNKMLDIELALEQAAGNEQLAKELLQMLLNELPTLLAQLQSAVSAGNDQLMWEHAHKIYGSTAYCGVPALRSIAQQLENFVKINDLASVKEHTLLLSAEISQLLEHGPGLLQRSWIIPSS